MKNKKNDRPTPLRYLLDYIKDGTPTLINGKVVFKKDKIPLFDDKLHLKYLDY